MTFRKHLPWIAAATFAAAVAGCHNGNGDDDNSSFDPNGRTTVSDLASQQINSRTCGTQKPDEINGLTIDDSQTAIDVNTLTPGCSGS